MLIRRYTSQVVVSETGEVGFGSVPVQIIFCLKECVSSPRRHDTPLTRQAEQEEAEQSSLVLQVSWDAEFETPLSDR